MQSKLRRQALKHIEKEINKKKSEIVALQDDLANVNANLVEVPTWSCLVSSAWEGEGEPSWEGQVIAPTVRNAVYQAMLNFCKNAGRIYPGRKDTYGTINKVWDHFDVQGTVYISMKLPGGTSISVDRKTIDDLTKEFNKKAPMPPKPKRRQPVGLTQ